LLLGAYGVKFVAPQPAISSESELNQQLFAAVQRYLANVPRQDQPKRIMRVEKIGANRYRVQMEMVQGVGYFEVWQEESTWQVRGLQMPGE
jgi:hypothetical protein